MIAAAIPRDAPRPPIQSRYLDDVREGWRFLREDRPLFAIAVTATATNVVVSPLFSVIMPIFVNERFGSARDLGLAFAGVGAGSLAGAFGFVAIGTRTSPRTMLLAGFGVLSVPCWVLVTGPSLPVIIMAMVLGGLGAGIIIPLVGTVMQQRTPVTLRGGVQCALMGVAILVIPIGTLLGGTMIETIGFRPFVLTMAVALLTVFASMLVNPSLHEMDEINPASTT